jgi:hypothetical protein
MRFANASQFTGRLLHNQLIQLIIGVEVLPQHQTIAIGQGLQQIDSAKPAITGQRLVLHGSCNIALPEHSLAGDCARNIGGKPHWNIILNQYVQSH